MGVPVGPADKGQRDFDRKNHQWEATTVHPMREQVIPMPLLAPVIRQYLFVKSSP